MKKIFKGLSILVASTALCAGVAMATACNSGYNGTYEGEYEYPNPYSAEATHYGMKVKVTVENNIITKVEDVTGDTYVSISPTNPYSPSWTEDSIKNWKDNEAWLLQQYEGWSVSDVLAIKVYIKTTGEPYELKNENNVATQAQLEASKLIIGGATQSSGRLLLAIQDALSK